MRGARKKWDWKKNPVRSGYKLLTVAFYVTKLEDVSITNPFLICTYPCLPEAILDVPQGKDTLGVSVRELLGREFT